MPRIQHIGRKIFMIILAIALILGGSWFYHNVYLPIKDPKLTATRPNNLTAENIQLEIKEGVYYATGSLVNNGQTKYNHVTVEINLCDENNKIIATTSTNLESFDSYVSRQFEAPIKDITNISTAQVKRILAY